MPGLCRPQVQLMSLSRSRAERRSCRGCAGRLQFGRGKATGRPVPIGRECPVLWIADAKADVAKSTRLVESECGAVAVGRTYLLPPLSFGGALLVRPWLRFHTHRVTGGGRPPPVPTERGVRISRTNALRQLLHSTASACSSR